MTTKPTIPVVTVGITRHTAVLSADLFAGTPYYLAAVLDLTESPKAHQYSPQNLGTVLHALFPRARALVCGTAVGEEILEEIKPVWEGYVNGMLREEGGGSSCWAAVSHLFSFLVRRAEVSDRC